MYCCVDLNKIKYGKGVTLDAPIQWGRPLILEFVPGKNYRRRLPYTGLVKIGDYTWFGCGVMIEVGGFRTTTIGEHCWIDHYAIIAHDVEIGDRTIIGPNVILLGEVVIGNDCHIAAGAVIQPKVKIGNRCLIGNNTVITKDVPDGWIVFRKGELVTKPNKWYPPNSDYDTTAHHRCF